MKSYRNLIDGFYRDNLIGSWKHEESGKYGWMGYVFMAVLFVFCLIFYLNIDTFNLRPVNQMYCFSNESKEEIKLLDIIKTEEKRRDIAYDYSETLRKEKICVEFVGNIKEINKTDNQWQIVTYHIYEPFFRSDIKSFSIWLDEIPNIIDLEQGDKVKIKGSLNGINKDWIIVSDAEVVV